MPTLTQLEYIVTVDRLKHFGKAADACHVSQPSLSQQIQKVEEELGIIIFDRVKKPVIPTEKGKRFIEQAKVVIRESQKLVEVSQKDGAEISGEFTLGIIPTLAPYLIPLFIEKFAVNYPKVDLKIDEIKTKTIIQLIKDDELDGAILAGPLEESGIRERVLFLEPFYLYLSKDHPLANRKKIEEDHLESGDVWLLRDGHCFRNQVVKVCSLKKESSAFKNIHFEGGNLETLRYLVKKTKGYTLIPQLFVDTMSDTEIKEHVREFTNPVPSREVVLVSRRDHWKSDILNAIENGVKMALPKSLKTNSDKRKSHIVGI